MATQGEDAGGGGRTERGVRVTLDIWHPDCWTLEVTAEADAGLLGHGVHSIDGTATGRFTAYADSTDELDAVVEAIRASDLTDSVWETDDDAGAETPLEGSATRGLVVRYDLSKSINDALVSRGFIPDEPVRMQDGRERWTVLVQETRRTVHERLEAVREEMDADVRYGPYVTDEDHPLVESLTDATRGVTGEDPAYGYFASVGDFNYLGDRAGLPTVILGPDGENIHGAGEFVYLDDVVEVADIVTHAALDLLG